MTGNFRIITQVMFNSAASVVDQGLIMLACKLRTY
jgi:hypothetical protein